MLMYKLFVLLLLLSCRENKVIEKTEPGIYELIVIYQDTVLKIGVMHYEQFNYPPCLDNGNLILYYPTVGDVTVASNVRDFVTTKEK